MRHRISFGEKYHTVSGLTKADRGELNRKLISLLFCGLLLTSLHPTLAQSAEIKLSSGLGYDDNPFRLANDFSAEKEVYWKNQIDISLGKSLPWSADLKVIDNHYKDQYADSTVVSWGLDYKNKFGAREHRAEVSLNGRLSDRTYVSRFSGDVFEINDVQAGDRYDYKRLSPSARFRFNLPSRNKILTSVEYSDQHYDDFSQFGISNLDYSSWLFDIAWQNYLTNKFRYEIQLDYEKRDYDDRRARAANGDRLSDSSLEYQVSGIGLKTRYRFSRQTYLYTNIGLGRRSDNGGGYYDTETLKASVRFRHKTASDSVWSLALYYQNLEYDRGQLAGDIENDAEAPDSEGFRGTASYERPVGKLAGGNLSWYASLRFYDYSSENPIYAYYRTTIETGLKFLFSP